jgi:hypothetical protein
MHLDYLTLIHNAIEQLKESSSPLLATREEWEALASIAHLRPETASALATPELNMLQPAPSPKNAQIKRAASETKPTSSETEQAPLPPPAKQQANNVEKESSHIGRFLKGASFILSEQIPDDKAATRTMLAWQECIGNVEGVILCCDPDAETLAMIKNLCKSIDQKLAKAKILSAERLEQEQRWDLFLAKNPLKCIIATAGFAHLKDAMRYYKHIPSNSTHFFGTVPLIILSPPSIYAQSPHEKISVWNQICYLLKR